MKYKFGQMKRRYFELIDDKSNDYKFYQMQGMLKNYRPSYLERKMNEWKGQLNKRFIYINSEEKNSFKDWLSKTLKLQLGVLLPDSSIKIIWDCFILFLLLINVFYIPMKISFEEISRVNQNFLLFFDDLPSWAFLCDIIITFNTAYYSKGVINEKRSKIFKHYVRGSFSWDLLIVGPFLFSALFNVKFLNIILLLRSSKILKIVKSIEELLNLK